MIDKNIIVACIREPMEQYHQKCLSTIGNWKPLVDVSEKILAGREVQDDEVPSVFLFLIEWMQLIMEVTRDSEWDWSNPAIQEIYRKIAESEIYKIFADATVGIVSSIMRAVPIGTVVEIGTGPGQVTEGLCREMARHDMSVPVIISDKTPGVARTGERLRKSFPRLSIHDFVWDFRNEPPEELVAQLVSPVLVYERFCIPYGGYSSIDRIAPIADILVMVEDLNLTGKKEAYDIIYEKIGSQFFTYQEARKYLEKHFPFIHTCDTKTIEAINLPVTDFILAMK